MNPGNIIDFLKNTLQITGDTLGQVINDFLSDCENSRQNFNSAVSPDFVFQLSQSAQAIRRKLFLSSNPITYFYLKSFPKNEMKGIKKLTGDMEKMLKEIVDKSSNQPLGKVLRSPPYKILHNFLEKYKKIIQLAEDMGFLADILFGITQHTTRKNSRAPICMAPDINYFDVSTRKILSLNSLIQKNSNLHFIKDTLMSFFNFILDEIAEINTLIDENQFPLKNLEKILDFIEFNKPALFVVFKKLSCSKKIELILLEESIENLHFSYNIIKEDFKAALYSEYDHILNEINFISAGYEETLSNQIFSANLLLTSIKGLLDEMLSTPDFTNSGKLLEKISEFEDVVNALSEAVLFSDSEEDDSNDDDSMNLDKEFELAARFEEFVIDVKSYINQVINPMFQKNSSHTLNPPPDHNFSAHVS